MENNTEEKKEKGLRKGLSLRDVSEGLRIGTKKNGVNYSVRTDRSRYFFPEEWEKFYESLRAESKPLFDFLVNTGARIEEALNVKPEHFEQERKTLTLWVTKTKASKGESYGRKRTFVLSSQFIRRMNSYIKENKIQTGSYLFPVTKQAVSQMMKRKLKSNFKDWYMFSLHNIRKTHGNWLKALEIPAEEICLRLGHDFNTYLRHYGSATIFDRKDKIGMIKILGDVYGLK
jgi:integrase